jgi:hypothetical protein
MTNSSSNRANKASIHAVIGASGSGKTTHVMQCVKRGKPQRLLVWDTKGEFAREGYAQPVRKITEVTAIIKAAGARGAFKIAFQPSGDAAKMKSDFSKLCLIAFYAKNCWLIAEELAEVTLAHTAPEGWRKATTQGRSEGLTIYGLSQSPAWVDKFFWGNCSTIRTGRLNFEAHIKTMAQVMGVPKDEILNLNDLEFIHMTTSPKKLERGKIRF